MDPEDYRDKWLDERFKSVEQQYGALRDSQIEMRQDLSELRQDFRSAVADIKAENRHLSNIVHAEIEHTRADLQSFKTIVNRRFDQNLRWSIAIGISAVAATVAIMCSFGIGFTLAPPA